MLEPSASTSSGERRWATPLSLGLMPVATGAAALLAPSIHLDDAVVDFATFLTPAAVAFAALLLGSFANPPRRLSLSVVALAAAALLGVAFAGAYSMGKAVLVGASLVALGWGIGLPIGRRVQHAGHLLPACVIAASADIVSVFSPSGPTRAIVESERALSVLAIPFPVLGTEDAVPTLGAGDIVFVGLLFGVVATHGLSRARLFTLALLGTLLAGLASALLQAAVPALPAIGLTTLLGFREARVLPPRDRKTASVAMAVAAALAIATIVSALVGRN